MKNVKTIIAFLFCIAIGTGLYAQDNISPERKQAIDSLALEKVRDLSKYITLVGNKNTAFSEAQRIIERATELFSADAEFGVSTLASPKVKYYKVPVYFERLSRLNYDRVEIEWYDIHYVSNLEKQPDGTYVGVITIYQKFKGYDKEGDLIYQDTTKKDITVYVKQKETQIAGRTVEFWDVLLGDVRVKETTL
ncbi:MAG: hypothetical protein ACEPOV_02410 [Hyphomicrobiales bacterium]